MGDGLRVGGQAGQGRPWGAEAVARLVTGPSIRPTEIIRAQLAGTLITLGPHKQTLCRRSRPIHHPRSEAGQARETGTWGGGSSVPCMSA